MPRADEHQSEYVPPSAERLRWLTGFTGSAGMAVVGRRGAALLVDGRYTVQARQQVDTRAFEILPSPETTAADWLKQHLAKGARVGYDPWLHTVSQVAHYSEMLDAKGIKLQALARNPIDRLWGRARPRPPDGRVDVHPLKLAGKRAEDKIVGVQKQLKADAQDAVILTLTDSVAWLFNIRGSDVAHNPVVLAFAIVPQTGKPELFLDTLRGSGRDTGRLDAEARAHLAGIAKMLPVSALGERVKALKDGGKCVRLDFESAAQWFRRALGKDAVSRGRDPCIAPKAIKNAAEIKGARAAHQRDGVAVVRFLAWLDREAVKGALDEIGAVKKLEECRRASTMLREISFDTISGAGPNGAIVHYRVTEATNRRLKSGDLFLINSGGQYLDGTTDITRTVAIGAPSAEMRQRFTAVLKGHIAIAIARFPKDTRGIDLDPLARNPLWQLGLDYDHGTGHGVGSYLSVHEGPQSISRRGMTVLEPGMILSNEPGYYKEGAYGIRIENLVLVCEPEKPDKGERAMMSFETLTLAPIDRCLVAAEMLTEAERGWLDAYHARVRREIAPELEGETRAWLLAATEPLGGR